MNEISPEELEQRTKIKFDSGKKTKALVAFVDLLGFTNHVYSNWDSNADDFIKRVLTIKSFVELAKEKGKIHTFTKYDKTTIIDTTTYPDFITISDAFIFFKVIDETSSQTRIISILSIVGSIYELWRSAIYNGFTIRGAIEYGDVFYSSSEVIGPSYIDAYKGESNEAKNSRIICLPNLLKIINDNVNLVDSVLQDYCRIWFKIEKDNLVVLNPLTAFGIDHPDRVQEALEMVKEMEVGVESDSVKEKYRGLIEYLSDNRAIYSDLDIFNTNAS